MDVKIQVMQPQYDLKLEFIFYTLQKSCRQVSYILMTSRKFSLVPSAEFLAYYKQKLSCFFFKLISRVDFLECNLNTNICCFYCMPFSTSLIAETGLIDFLYEKPLSFQWKQLNRLTMVVFLSLHWLLCQQQPLIFSRFMLGHQKKCMIPAFTKGYCQLDHSDVDKASKFAYFC